MRRPEILNTADIARREALLIRIERLTELPFCKMTAGKSIIAGASKAKNRVSLNGIILVVLFSSLLLTGCRQAAEQSAPVSPETEAAATTSEPEPETEYDPWILTAEQAKEAVDMVLDMQSQASRSPVPMPKPKMPSGAEIPANGQAGTPELIEKDGTTVYEVPVLVNGKRVGEFYVKQRFTKDGKVEFIGGDISELTVPKWSPGSY